MQKPKMLMTLSKSNNFKVNHIKKKVNTLSTIQNIECN